MTNAELYNKEYKGLTFTIIENGDTIYKLGDLTNYNLVNISWNDGATTNMYVLHVVLKHIANNDWKLNEIYFRKKKLQKLLGNG